MLDASNPDGSKAKKPKNQNRPVQRFWPENIATIQQQQAQQLSKASTEGVCDDVTSSPNLSESEGLGEPPQHQVMSSEQATVTLAPQPIVLPPGGRILTHSLGMSDIIFQVVSQDTVNIHTVIVIIINIYPMNVSCHITVIW